MQIIVHNIFHGIQFYYVDIHRESIACIGDEMITDDVMEIVYCTEGRVEFNHQEEYYDIVSGDLAIMKTKEIPVKKYFPTCHFHGVSVRIDVKYLEDMLQDFFHDTKAHPAKLMDKFCSKKMGTVLRADTSIQHIMADIHSISKNIEKRYLKLKVLELLLYLSTVELDSAIICHYSQRQNLMAKSVVDYLTEHKDEHITLEQAAHHFQISETHLKNIFKKVYGVSYYAYIKMQKMRSAADMLEHTDKSILEIAGEHGYENGSKFSSAFKSVIGMNPTEYRKFKNRNV